MCFEVFAMDFNVRIMQINQIITEKGVVSFEELLEATGSSPATLKRDLSYMRKSLDAPIVYSRIRGGYLFAKSRQSARRADFYEKPSAWFTPDELLAMVTTVYDFENLEKNRKGYLSKEMSQLASRLRMALFQDQANEEELFKRVNVVRMRHKPMNIAYFEVIGQALVHRKRLKIEYVSENSGKKTNREVSPLRLTYCRGRWYLDAFCHERDEIRRFLAPNVLHAEITDTGAKIVSMKQIEEELDSLYGVYQSAQSEWATIRFTGVAAKIVAYEIWHANQVGHWMSDEIYELKIPCLATSPELVGDILRFGPNAKVLEPEALAQAVQTAASQTAQNYASAK